MPLCIFYLLLRRVICTECAIVDSAEIFVLFCRSILSGTVHFFIKWCSLIFKTRSCVKQFAHENAVLAVDSNTNNHVSVLGCGRGRLWREMQSTSISLAFYWVVHGDKAVVSSLLDLRVSGVVNRSQRCINDNCLQMGRIYRCKRAFILFSLSSSGEVNSHFFHLWVGIFIMQSGLKIDYLCSFHEI